MHDAGCEITPDWTPQALQLGEERRSRLTTGHTTATLAASSCLGPSPSAYISNLDSQHSYTHHTLTHTHSSHTRPSHTQTEQHSIRASHSHSVPLLVTRSLTRLIFSRQCCPGHSAASRRRSCTHVTMHNYTAHSQRTPTPHTSSSYTPHKHSHSPSRRHTTHYPVAALLSVDSNSATTRSISRSRPSLPSPALLSLPPPSLSGCTSESLYESAVLSGERRVAAPAASVRFNLPCSSAMLWLDDPTTDDEGRQPTMPSPHSTASTITFSPPPQWRVVQRERRREKRRGHLAAHDKSVRLLAHFHRC